MQYLDTGSWNKHLFWDRCLQIKLIIIILLSFSLQRHWIKMYSGKNNWYDGDRFFKGVFPDIFLSFRLPRIPMSRALALPKPPLKRALRPGWLLLWWVSWIPSSSLWTPVHLYFEIDETVWWIVMLAWSLLSSQDQFDNKNLTYTFTLTYCTLS